MSVIYSLLFTSSATYIVALWILGESARGIVVHALTAIIVSFIFQKESGIRVNRYSNPLFSEAVVEYVLFAVIFVVLSLLNIMIGADHATHNVVNFAIDAIKTIMFIILYDFPASLIRIIFTKEYKDEDILMRAAVAHSIQITIALFVFSIFTP